MLYLASQILDAAKRRYSSVYTDAERRITVVLKTYLRDRPAEFSGTQWDFAVRQIAQTLYEADLKAVRVINEQLAEAYAEGSNVTLYQVEKQLGHEISVLPYTSAVVSALVEANVLSLNTKSLNKTKDDRWGKTKLFGAVRVAARMSRIHFDNLAPYIARRVVNGMKKSMDDAAQVVVFGSYDDGIYKAGIEVQNAGINVDKTWLAIMDANVRDSHHHLNDTTVPVNVPFQSFHGPIRFPHDPDAASEEICGCRCRMAVHLRGKVPKYDKSRILPTEVSAYRQWRDERISALGGEVELIRRHLVGK